MDKITELLTRGVDTIYPSKEELEKVLRSGKKLTLYQGFDPTGSQLHIGHMIGFRKLRQWQDLGHKVIFLIGDGTGQAGDPSGKLQAREKFFTNTELRENAKEYVMQAGKIVRFTGENPIEIRYNGDWLNKLSLMDILEIAGNFSLQQLSERDMYQERMKKGESVNMREFLYPLLQGYDSVAMNVDLELGGSDQMFNMMCGRTLVKNILKKEKFVMTTPLLEDSEGRKIGKSEGNVIGLTDQPADLYGKIMALGDDIILKGFEYLTDIELEKIAEMKKAMESGENPVKFKKELAFELVKQLNTEEAAKSAEDTFLRVVQNKELPTEIETVSVTRSTAENTTIENLLVDLGLSMSKSEAKRLVEQGGVTLNETKVTDANARFSVENESLLRVGKRKIVKITIG